MRKIVHISFAIGWITLLPITLKSDEIHVPGDLPTIQAAIDAASDGDQIIVATGTYMENINFSGKAIAIRSSDGPLMTTIDGGGSGSVVTCSNGEGPASILQGFTVTGGSAIFGGGMHNDNTSPTVTGCRFVGNVADAGGGMFSRGPGNSEGTSPTITDCVFAMNSAEFHGGGMTIESYTNSTVMNCSFISNVRGGMQIGASGETLVVNCAFESNTDRAALFVFGHARIVNCVFFGNSSEQGAAIRRTSGSGLLTVSNCTIVANTASDVGGGLYLIDSSPRTTILNTILWANSPDQIFSVSVQPTVSYSNVQGGWSGEGSSNIDADPLFVDAAKGDLHLVCASPCNDLGNSLYGLPVDLDRQARAVDVAAVPNKGIGPVRFMDIGAFEFQDTTSGCCVADLDGDGAVGASDLAQLLGSWGPCPACPANLDRNGEVDAADLAILLGSWGLCE